MIILVDDILVNTAVSLVRADLGADGLYLTVRKSCENILIN